MMMTLFDDDQILKAYTKEIQEETARKTARETEKETARHLFKQGKLSLEDIAECIPSLSLDNLKKLEAEVTT